VARGKEAAQAANRRLVEAQERIAELEKQASEREAAYRSEVTELRTELQQARNRLVREVGVLAKQAISDAQAEASSQVAEARSQHTEQVIAGVELLNSEQPEGIQLHGIDGYVRLARAFGVQVGDLMGDSANRRARRSSNKQGNDVAAWREDVARAGRPLLVDSQAATHISLHEGRRPAGSPGE
jgi:hypothetical protein